MQPAAAVVKASTARMFLATVESLRKHSELRYKWEHGVPFEHVDRFHGRDYVRTDGMSASWRCLVPGVL